MFIGFGNRRVGSSTPSARSGLAGIGVNPAEIPPLEVKASHPDKTADMAGNKRDGERVMLDGHVRGEVMVFQPMTILDIGLGGAQIETAFALQIDSLHDFRLSLGDRSVVVRGRIAHCHIGELTDVAAYYRTGVEFVELSDHAAHAISDFVHATQFAREVSVVDGEIAGDPERA